MNTRLLLLVAVITLIIFWLPHISFDPLGGIMVDGILTSATIVTGVLITFSVISWVLLSWATKKPILSALHTPALLGLIVSAPISGIIGPMLAIILGVVVGCAARTSLNFVEGKK